MSESSTPETPVATAVEGNDDAPNPTAVAPAGDPSLSRTEQPAHPFSDPVGDPSAGPKVDAGDTGAAVGEGDTAKATRAAQRRADAESEAGFKGHNPDPRPNEDYTVEGVTR